MTTPIKAPFTDEQLENLLWWQDCGMFHPYTCPNRSWKDHAYRVDLGSLLPRKDGLYCPDCGYLQTWAHDFKKTEFTPGFLETFNVVR